ncbi:MAG: helix-turn-helix domain-containing protein, partial [Caulobacteraceae bacterium]
MALADMIAVTPQSVSQYESGRQAPRPEVLGQIASKLNVPISYFTRPPAEIDDAPIFWRCRATASKVARERAEIRLLWVKDILSYLGQFLDFPEVNLPDLDPP